MYQMAPIRGHLFYAPCVLGRAEPGTKRGIPETGASLPRNKLPELGAGRLRDRVRCRKARRGGYYPAAL